MEADALLCIPWERTQMEKVEPLVVKTMLQSKIEPEVDVSEEYLPERMLLKSMTMDTMPKLT